MHSLVLGIGDTAFRDRGVGPEVVRRLQRRNLTDITLAVADGGRELEAEDVLGA